MVKLYNEFKNSGFVVLAIDIRERKTPVARSLRVGAKLLGRGETHADTIGGKGMEVGKSGDILRRRHSLVSSLPVWAAAIAR